MPRLHHVRERRHQPFYDTVIRTDRQPTPLLPHRVSLFGNANIGDLSRTNLQVAGQFASDQTYVILALRLFAYFEGACLPIEDGAESCIVSFGGV